MKLHSRELGTLLRGIRDRGVKHGAILIGAAMLGVIAAIFGDITKSSQPSVASLSAQSPRETNFTHDLVLASDAMNITHVFELRNDSGQRLLLQEPVRGCGCSDASLDRQDLLPDQSAALTVSVRVPRDYEGEKRVVTTVASKSGEIRRFNLIIPVIQRCVIPPRLAMRPSLLQPDAVLSRAISQIKLRGESAASLPTAMPVFACDKQGLQITPLGSEDSVVSAAGSKLVSRQYSFQIDLLSAESRLIAIDWTSPGYHGTTYVDVLTPELAKVLPARTMLSGLPSESFELTLALSSRDLTAKLLEFPDFVIPDIHDKQLTVDDPVAGFRVGTMSKPPRIGKITFQILRNDKPVGEAIAIVVPRPVPVAATNGGKNENPARNE